MSDVEVICGCGRSVRMSAFAVGMPAACPECKRPLDYTQVRPIPEEGPAPVETFASGASENSDSKDPRSDASDTTATRSSRREPEAARSPRSSARTHLSREELRATSVSERLGAGTASWDDADSVSSPAAESSVRESASGDDDSPAMASRTPGTRSSPWGDDSEESHPPAGKNPWGDNDSSTLARAERREPDTPRMPSPSARAHSSSEERSAITPSVESGAKSNPWGDDSGTMAPAPEVAPQRGRAECVRCGRRFRGEWDIHETSKGPLCHICANRVAEVAPQESVSNVVEPVTSIYLPGTREAAGLLNIPPPSDTVPTPKYQFDPHSPVFRRILWVAAVGMIVLTIFLFMTEGSLPTPDERSSASSAEAPTPMGKLPFVLILAVQAVCNCGGTALALFLTLWHRNKLPMDSWWGNALHVGVVGLGLGAVQAVLSHVPMAGGICALVVTFWVCFEVYDFGFVDFVTLFFLGIPASFIVWITQVMFLGLIAKVFF